MLPSIFLCHRAPTLPLSDARRSGSCKTCPRSCPRARSRSSRSRALETTLPRASAVDRDETFQDFDGFQRELYMLRCPAPGSPALAARVVDLLSAAGIAGAAVAARGLDHGYWVPLLLMYLKADLPVVQLSIQRAHDVGAHLALGRTCPRCPTKTCSFSVQPR